MSVSQLYKNRFDYNDGMIIEIVVWQVPKPVVGSQYHYKYRLFYGNAEHKRVVGYDNERRQRRPSALRRTRRNLHFHDSGTTDG